MATIKYDRKKLIKSIEATRERDRKAWTTSHAASRVEALKLAKENLLAYSKGVAALEAGKSASINTYNCHSVHWDAEEQFNTKRYDTLVARLELTDDDTIAINDRDTNYFSFL